MLAFGGPVADFAPVVAADDSLLRLIGLAVVEPDPGTALQIGIQYGATIWVSAIDYGEFGDLYKWGVIGPTKVVRTALEAATSIVGLSKKETAFPAVGTDY